MESGLTPRQIQERIRAGQSLDEVAAVAGMPRDRVERFALAVIDERRHLAEQARGHSVRRDGEAGSHRTLGGAVESYFAQHDVDLDNVEWDATRGDDRHFWTVTVTWVQSDEVQTATFGYDVRGTFSVAEDATALDILGSPADEEPGEDESDDNEPTINYADQFAIVNAVQEEPDNEEPDAPAASNAGPFSLQDIVPTPESELDALYAMLRGHQEDSVNIYAGLAESQPPPPSEKSRRRRRSKDEEPAAETDEQPVTDETDQQPPLVEAESVPEPPRPKKRTRKRAAVPTWDEIMFGGPDAD